MKRKVKKKTRTTRRKHEVFKFPKGKRKNHLDRFFLLNWKKSVAIVALWILSIFTHTTIFNFYMIQEPISFMIAILVIPAYLIASIVYTLDFHRGRK